MTTQEIADELDRVTGVDINRRRISQQSLREIGTHEVPVRLGTEVSPLLKITIIPEDELREFLAARERGEKSRRRRYHDGRVQLTRHRQRTKKW